MLSKYNRQLTELEDSLRVCYTQLIFSNFSNILSQSKQMQIDDLLVTLNNASGDMERLRDEKDQEILILQEGMDSTIQSLSEAQQVRLCPSTKFY